MTRRPESVVVVVLGGQVDDPRVLLLERNDWPGFWQSVTGSLLEDESAGAAACRELQEETGIDAPPESLNQWQEFPIAPHRRGQWAKGVSVNREHAFRLLLPDCAAIRMDPAEHRQWGWFELGIARWLVSSRTNRKALDLALNRSQVSNDGG